MELLRRDGATVGRGGGGVNASIYNVLSLAICLNKFTFYLLNNIIDLFKSYKKFIDSLKSISLRANLSPNNIQNKPTQRSKKKKKQRRSLSRF